MEAVHANAQVGLDTSELDAQADDARAKVDDLDEAQARPTVTLDTSDLDAKADDARGKVDDLGEAEARPAVTLDTGDLDAQADEAKAKVDDLDATEAHLQVTLDDSDLDAKAEEAKAELDDLGAKTVTPKVTLNDSQFQEKLAQDKAEADSASGDEGSGGLIGGIALGVSSLLPGVGGAAAGLGLLAGTSALAFTDIGKALSAHSQATQTVGTTTQQLASTAFTNTVQIQQAQQAVGDAYRQAAEDGVSSSEQIASAQSSLAETVRNAASSEVQAQEAVAQAGQQLEDAQFSETQAQVNLTNARIQARITLQQLNDAETDSVLATQAASLALQQAQYQQTLTDQNAMSTDLDKEQAALAVAQAQRQLVEAQQNQVNSAQAAQLADKLGVEGSQSVVQAKQSVLDATNAVGNAQQAQTTANQNLTDTQLNNAQQIQQAQLSVTEAEQQASNQQQQDAEAIASAQQNLTDTYKEQRLAAAATASTSNQAAGQFAKDMAAMSPQARAFTRELLGMDSAYHRLQDVAQAAILPGVNVFLHGIQSLLPVVDTGVQKMGTVLSQVFAGIGKQMDTPGVKDILSGLITNGVRFAQVVLPALAQFVEELGKIGAQKGASDGVANLLAGLARGLTGVATAVAPYTKQINEFLTAAGNIVAAIGPPLGRIVGLIATTLGPLTRYLDSHPDGTVVKVIGDILAGLLAFKGLKAILSGPLEAGMKAAKSLGSAITGLPQTIDKLSTGISSFGTGTGTVFTKIGGYFSRLGTSAGGLWDTIQLKGMYAWESISGFGSKLGSMLSGAASSAGNFASQYASKLGEAAGKVPGLFSSAWSTIESGAGTALGTMGRWGEQLGSLLGTAAGNVGRWGTQFAETMASAAGSAARFVVELAGQLADAAVAAGTWIAENTVTAATFVAENITMAASATAAFIAENAASLGLVAALAAVVAGIVFLATHWQQAWADIQQWAQDAWNFVKNGFETFLMPYFGATGLIGSALSDLEQRWSQVWNGIMTATHTVVTDLGAVWGTLENVFKNPVNFLITTVYDNGIRRLWDDVVGAIGLGSLKLPDVPKLSAGARLPGYGGGDVHPALLEAGETVVDKDTSRVLAPVFQAAGVPGYSGGGIIGDIGSAIGGAISTVGHDIMSAGKFAAEVVSDPSKAVTDLLGHVIGSNAAGELGKVMTGIPTALAGDLAKAIASTISASGGSLPGGSLPGGSSTAVGDLPANWRQIATFLSTHGFTKFAAAGVAGNIDAESGGNPEILEIGGGGGGGLIQWTPYPPGYITGNAAADLLTQLNAILRWGGGPGEVNKATSPSNAAEIYQDLYERPASLTASLGVRMASANAVYKAMGWGSFDSGGWLMPAAGPNTVPINTTGQPEAVLNPAESAALIRLASHLSAGGGGAAPAPVVNMNYFGPQAPTPEMKALQMRDLALALSGNGS